MPTKPWFPTLVYQSRLQGQATAAVAAALLSDCRAVRDGDTAGLLWCQTNYPFGYTSYETFRQLHRTSSPFERLGTPPGCSAITFQDPRAEMAAGTPPKMPQCRPENQRTISYAAQAGTVILFESWLRHEVPANPTVEERVSVSFNYAWV